MQSSKVKIITGNFIVIVVMFLMTSRACAEIVTLGHYNHQEDISQLLSTPTPITPINLSH